MLSVGMWTWPLYSSLEIVKMKESTASGGGEDAGSAYENACEALTLGLFISDFKNPVHEGDGDHMPII